jgi:hypothetical protein
MHLRRRAKIRRLRSFAPVRNEPQHSHKLAVSLILDVITLLLAVLQNRTMDLVDTENLPILTFLREVSYRDNSSSGTGKMRRV